MGGVEWLPVSLTLVEHLHLPEDTASTVAGPLLNDLERHTGHAHHELPAPDTSHPTDRLGQSVLHTDKGWLRCSHAS